MACTHPALDFMTKKQPEPNPEPYILEGRALKPTPVDPPKKASRRKKRRAYQRRDMVAA
jgi:hypothetical protein